MSEEETLNSNIISSQNCSTDLVRTHIGRHCANRREVKHRWWRGSSHERVKDKSLSDELGGSAGKEGGKGRQNQQYGDVVVSDAHRAIERSVCSEVEEKGQRKRKWDSFEINAKQMNLEHFARGTDLGGCRPTCHRQFH